MKKLSSTIALLTAMLLNSSQAFSFVIINNSLEMARLERIIWVEGWNANGTPFNFWYDPNVGALPIDFGGISPLTSQPVGLDLFGTNGVDYDLYTPTLTTFTTDTGTTDGLQMDWGIANSPKPQLAGWLFDMGGPTDLSSADIGITANGPTGVSGISLILEDADGGWGAVLWSAGTTEFPNDVDTLLSINASEFSTVPIPGAAWLFGSGLTGLVGAARRKKA